MPQIFDLVDVIETARQKISSLIDDLQTGPESSDRKTKVVHLWRLALLALIYDVSGSIATLARLHDDNHVRAMRILDRSLFEYDLRLGYYQHFPDKAVEHADNLPAWQELVRRNAASLRKAEDVEDVTTGQRVKELLKKPERGANILRMLRDSVLKNGHPAAQAERITDVNYRHYYASASAQGRSVSVPVAGE